MMPSSSAFRRIAGVSIASIVFCCARQASAATVPHVVIVHDHWTSSTGACKDDVARATVTGVPTDVKLRIDGFLARTLASNTVYDGPESSFGAETPQRREADCAEALKDNAGRSYGKPWFQHRSTDWTVGWATGRWISMRSHATIFSLGNAHPSDAYQSITFDLAHGGYPVPTSGFYLASQRASFNERLLAAEIAQLATYDGKTEEDPDTVRYLHFQAQAAKVDASQIFVTTSGLEVTNFLDVSSAQNLILATPFAKLQGVGTTGGPLDAATR